MASSRITLQGEANLIRNRGTMGSIFNMEDNVSNGYISARPCSRLTTQSHDNQVRSTKGTMEKFLKVDNNVHQGFDSTPCARVTNQSEPNYIKGQGTMAKWLNVEENVSSGYESARPAPRACPSETSQAMKEKSKGVMSEYIGTDSEYRSLAIEKKIHPRGVPSTALANSEPHKGKRMEMILHSAEKMPDSPKRCGRTIKPETEHIAARHQGKPVANLITNYGCLGMSERAPRVTVWGEDNMALDRGRMKQLIDEQQRPRTVRPASGALPGQPLHIP
ncbi:hypothetical protein EB796_005972 [Bugula neritina]|uniref:Uncharacterized protein n=1 Tax=Bugula neritina TaxID=10212 RepID=A0A7J7KAP3_BUGNE|nr:hypothetical protein EB796_005972 [Bugula neritina]